MNVPGLNAKEVERLLEEVKGVQGMMEIFAPMVSVVAPTLGETAKTAISSFANPAVAELRKLLGSKEAKKLIQELALMGADARLIAAEAKLATPVRKAVAATSKVKALNAKAQLDAFTDAGFTRPQAMKLLEQMIIADAIRDAKPKSSFPNFPDSKKKNKK